MNRYYLILSGLLFLLNGCGGDPTLYPITGKITLGGKSYERLLVYFKPIEGEVTRFNMGVGETDKDGRLSLRSSAGMGLAGGKYRVTFSCYVVSGVTLGADQKVDEIAGAETKIPVEIVPEIYAETSGNENSPVVFEIQSGENIFDFDIPAKL